MSSRRAAETAGPPSVLRFLRRWLFKGLAARARPKGKVPAQGNACEHSQAGAQVQSSTAFAAAVLRTARRTIIFVVGISVVAVGLAMIVLPGPALVVIPAGLAILATEFLWARRMLRKIADRLTKAMSR